MEMEDNVCPSFGACPSMGTANTMQMLGEVLNLVLPGTSTIPASDNAKLREARKAGKYTVELAKSGRKPSSLITKEVLLNAIMFDMAVAGSTNAVLHILSYAYELGIKLTPEDFETYARVIPCINAVVPSGPYTVVDFHYAGGVPNVMKMLESKLFTDTPTMYGTTWNDLLSHVTPQENKVIHSLERPLSTEPGLKILRGNLSPNGAIVRPTAVYDEVKYLKGKAKVFEGDRQAFDAISSGQIVPGDIIVIRYEGCKGAPGMKELMLSIDALIGLGLHKSVGLISDARFSGFNFGAIIGHVSPEAYDGGPIALVRNGDEIEIDIPNGTVNLLVSDEELAHRKEHWVCPPLKEEKGCLNIYARMCRSAEEGGALIGTGGQAATQLEAMLVARDLKEVRVFDLNYERTSAFAEEMQQRLSSYGTSIIAVKNSDEAIDNADLIITVTPSSTPVFDGTKVKKGATISCVGAYQHHMQELDSRALTRASKIYFDSEDAVLSESGDILLPLEQGIISKEDFTGDLGDVILGKLTGRENDDEIIIFETVGVATQDLVTAKWIYDRAKAAGVGTQWD